MVTCWIQASLVRGMNESFPDVPEVWNSRMSMDRSISSTQSSIDSIPVASTPLRSAEVNPWSHRVSRSKRFFSM